MATIDTPKINTVPSALQKEKQIARDQRPEVTRTASCNGDSTTKARHLRGELSTMSIQSDQMTSRLADWSKVSAEVPTILVNGNGEEMVNEEPLPPPEITSTSVMATIRLEGNLSDLKEAIQMYEEFDKICRDTPAWFYFAGQQVSNVRHGLRSIRHTAGAIAYLRDDGQGTVERGQLETLAREVLTIEKEGRKEWKDTSSAFKEKEKDEDPKLTDERIQAYRGFVDLTYAKKMKCSLSKIQEAAREIDTMKQQLKMDWEGLSKLTEKELEAMEEAY